MIRSSLIPAWRDRWLGLWTDVNKTTLEYEKMTEGDVSQEDYLRASPRHNWSHSRSCLTQSLGTNILRQKQILEVHAHIFTLRSIHRLHL